MHRSAHNAATGTNPWRNCRSVPIAIMLWAALLGSGIVTPACAQGKVSEYQVKAAFFFHFIQLVEWPPGALSASDQSIVLGIFEDEPRGKELRSTLEGKLVGTRALHVRILSRAEDVQGCNILFLSSDEVRRQTSILKSLRGLPVLTVGESDSFLSDGGMIRFHLDGDKVRFDINVHDADLAHLKISSRLLLLATTLTSSVGTAREGGYAH